MSVYKVQPGRRLLARLAVLVVPLLLLSAIGICSMYVLRHGEVKLPANAIVKHRVCDGMPLSLSCGNGTVIADILTAFYGRDDAKACAHPKKETMLNTKCSLKSASFDTIVACVGKPLCSPRFTDPCPGTHKWASITYTCAKRHAQ